jgi:hypothetical protein
VPFKSSFAKTQKHALLCSLIVLWYGGGLQKKNTSGLCHLPAREAHSDAILIKKFHSSGKMFN